MKIKNRILKLGVSVLFFLSAFCVPRSAFSQIPTVWFTNLTMIGTTNDTTITIKALKNPVGFIGSTYTLPVRGTNISTVGGVAGIKLVPNDYTIAFAGIPQSWTIHVTNSATDLNAADLTTDLVRYSGVQSLRGLGGITIYPPTGAGGDYGVSNSASGGNGTGNVIGPSSSSALTFPLFMDTLGAHLTNRTAAGTFGPSSFDAAGAAAAVQTFASAASNSVLNQATNAPRLRSPTIDLVESVTNIALGHWKLYLDSIHNRIILSNTVANVGFDCDESGLFRIGGGSAGNAEFNNAVVGQGGLALANVDIYDNGDILMEGGTFYADNSRLYQNGSVIFGYPGELGATVIDPTNEVQVDTLAGVKSFQISTNGIVFANLAGSTNGAPTLATNNAAASDGWALVKSGNNLKLVALTGSGTVTSAALTPPSGHSVSGSPITSSGTFVITRTGTEDFGNHGATNVSFIAIDQWQVITNPATHSLIVSNALYGTAPLTILTNSTLLINGVPLVDFTGASQTNQFLITDANTNPVTTLNGYMLTNMDTHFTNYGATTNIVLPADGNSWRVLATNGPHLFFSFGGNNMGAMSIWITTNGDAALPPQVTYLGYSDTHTTNCIIDLQPWGGTNRVLAGKSEL